ncbi:uncharacterized protein LOC125233466 [Leguminivora glycinivorella]|uniref:uncharacterized protein LOC125233466 n=1 Tax=Leguminivora glycinivorella TaxID=1035111 RepID=UPI00200C3EF3|nr:uncharacterized protein LOC125233466 [Leguminivora glycinivorella]
MFMPSICIKLIELAIASACLLLQQYSYDLTDVSTLILCSGTYLGFILVLTGEIIGEMVFAPLDVIQDVYFSVLGMAMSATCAWTLYSARTDAERNPRADDTLVSYTVALNAVNVLIMFCDTRVSTISAEGRCQESQ